VLAYCWICRSAPMALSAHDQMKLFWKKNIELQRPNSPWWIYRLHNLHLVFPLSTHSCCNCACDNKKINLSTEGELLNMYTQLPFSRWTWVSLHLPSWFSSFTCSAAVCTLSTDRNFLWSPYVIGQTIIFSSCFFFFLLLLFFSSPNLSSWRLDVYHTSAHGVVLV